MPCSYHVFKSGEFCADCKASDAEDARLRELELDAEIDRQTCEFANRVEEALTASYKARIAVEQLNGPLYWVEMAEGSEGGDALAELDTVLRSLRNLKRLAKAQRDILLSPPYLQESERAGSFLSQKEKDQR